MKNKSDRFFYCNFIILNTHFYHLFAKFPILTFLYEKTDKNLIFFIRICSERMIEKLSAKFKIIN